MAAISRISTSSILTMLAIIFVTCADQAAIAEEATSTGKQLYLPKNIDRVPENNDFDDNNSDFSFKRMVQGDNMAIFWHKEYGDNPMKHPNEEKRFDPNRMLEECERFYDYYVNELKFVQKGDSITDKYKMLGIVFGGDEGTAFGGGVDDKVGVLWTTSVRVRKEPYGVLAHEMTHCFQYLARIDTGTGAGGAVTEMAAQYFLWQVYPEWMTFENYHLVDFMKQTHYAFLHHANMYHSPYVFEYWANRHGREFFGKLNRSTQHGEDVVTTYKRLNSLTQPRFNDEMFDACSRFITWDMDRIREVAAPYANQHHCKLDDVGDGWHQIPAEKCPQNYGYNGIQLKVPEAGTDITLNFKGIAGAEGYSKVKTDKAGWRYGMLASLKDGKRVYGDVGKEAEGTLTFKVPDNTEYLWLVVMGAPTEHWPVVMRWAAAPGDTGEEQWPYQIKLTGTELDDSVLQ